MPFVLYQKPVSRFGGRVSTEPTVKMRRGGVNGTTVVLNSNLVRDLKWIAGDRVEVMIGTGTDAGVMVIRRAKTGFKLVKDGAKTRLKVSSRGLFPGDPVKTTLCRHEVRDGLVYIEVPKAFTAPATFNTTNTAFNINAMVAA